MTSVLIVVLCLLTAAFVLLPLRARASSEAIEYSNGASSHNASPRELLVEKRDSLLRQIKELEFDRAMDKINAEDYEHRRGELSSQAARVLQRLEAGETTDDVVALDSAVVPDFDVEAEVLVARARRKRALQNLLPTGATWTCECGRAMSEEDRFCASCGAARGAVASV